MSQVLGQGIAPRIAGFQDATIQRDAAVRKTWLRIGLFCTILVRYECADSRIHQRRNGFGVRIDRELRGAAHSDPSGDAGFENIGNTSAPQVLNTGRSMAREDISEFDEGASRQHCSGQEALTRVSASPCCEVT